MAAHLRSIASALALLSCWPSAASAEAAPIDGVLEVAADGSRPFETIGEALANVPDTHPGWVVIQVHPGVYHEALSIPAQKHHVVLIGAGRDETIVEYDESLESPGGRWTARPVLTTRADDVVVRGLTLHNLAGEPGGSGGSFDAAIQNEGDRLIVADVLLRGDHDTLLLYGPGAGFSGGRAYVRDSHVQGRGDFVASFSSVFIEHCVLETIRDRSHFLYQVGLPGGAEALVVRNSVFTGVSLDPTWPAGITNLFFNARVFLLENSFESNAGANRPVVHFHASPQALSSRVRHFGNTQNLSTQSPLLWGVFSAPGPPGTPRVVYPNRNNRNGEPIIEELAAEGAAAITPVWLFGDWDPRTQEPRLACEDGIDNDGDGRPDLDGGDPGCVSTSDLSELSETIACDNGLDDDGDGWTDFAGGDTGCATPGDGSELPSPVAGCGLGPELIVLLPLLHRMRRKRG